MLIVQERQIVFFCVVVYFQEGGVNTQLLSDGTNPVRTTVGISQNYGCPRNVSTYGTDLKAKL